MGYATWCKRAYVSIATNTIDGCFAWFYLVLGSHDEGSKVDIVTRQTAGPHHLHFTVDCFIGFIQTSKLLIKVGTIFLGGSFQSSGSILDQLGGMGNHSDMVQNESFSECRKEGGKFEFKSYSCKYILRFRTSKWANQCEIIIRQVTQRIHPLVVVETR